MAKYLNKDSVKKLISILSKASNKTLKDKTNLETGIINLRKDVIQQNKSVLDLFTEDSYGNPLFNMKNPSSATALSADKAKPGVKIKQKLYLDTLKDTEIKINANNTNLLTSIFMIQVYKLISDGNDEIMNKVLKEFNNNHAINFFYNSSNVTFNGDYAYIINDEIKSNLFKSYRWYNTNTLSSININKTCIKFNNSMTNENIMALYTSYTKAQSKAKIFNLLFNFNIEDTKTFTNNGVGVYFKNEQMHAPKETNIAFGECNHIQEFRIWHDMDTDNLKVSFLEWEYSICNISELPINLPFRITVDFNNNYYKIWIGDEVVQTAPINNHFDNLNRDFYIQFFAKQQLDVRKVLNMPYNANYTFGNIKIDPMPISRSELIVAKNDFRTITASHIEYFKLAASLYGEGNILLVCTIDGGVIWKSYIEDRWIDLDITIPLKPYNDLTDEEKVQWEDAKNVIEEYGIQCEELDSIDFNILECQQIRFAYLLIREGYDDLASMSKLAWSYRSKGNITKMEDTEVDIEIRKDNITITPLVDTDLIKINIISDEDLII